MSEIETSKRLIFCLSPGRCGTRYLAEMLKLCPGVHVEHEGKPDFVEIARYSRQDRERAKQWWLEEKLPAIEATEGDIYVETSHLFGKGPREALVELGVPFDVIALMRAPRDVALSFWRRGSIPGRTPRGISYLLHPAEPSFNVLENWRQFNAYQLCYWYALEAYAAVDLSTLDGHGVSWHVAAFGELVDGNGFKEIVKALDLPKPKWRRWGTIRSHTYNANPPHLQARMPAGDLDQMEKEVRDAIVDSGVRRRPTKGERVGIDVAVLCCKTMHKNVAWSLLEMATNPRYVSRYDIVVGDAWGNPTSSNRNAIAREFRFNERRPDWLMMIDDDNPPPMQWLDAIESGADVILFPAPCWKPNTGGASSPMVWNLVGENEAFIPITALPNPADAPYPEMIGGTGAILIHRRVIEHEAMRWPFKDEFDEDGVRKTGHDLTFCRRARDAGFKVVASLGHLCEHYNTVPLKEVATILATYERRLAVANQSKKRHRRP